MSPDEMSHNFDDLSVQIRVLALKEVNFKLSRSKQ